MSQQHNSSAIDQIEGIVPAIYIHLQSKRLFYALPVLPYGEYAKFPKSFNLSNDKVKGFIDSQIESARERILGDYNSSLVAEEIARFQQENQLRPEDLFEMGDD